MTGLFRARQYFTFPVIGALVLLCGGAAVLAEPFELLPDALYRYRVQVYGGWGKSATPLPPVAVQMQFQPRVTDYPCCPEQGFYQPPVREPTTGGNRAELKGFTQDPASGRINLLVPIISLDFMREARQGIAFGNTHIATLPIATATPLASTPDSNPNLRHNLRFEVRPDFSVRMRQAPYTNTGTGQISEPTDFRDVGQSDKFRSEGYFLVRGSLELPGGMPISMDRLPHENSDAFARAAPGWHSHYDIVAATRDNGKQRFASLPLYNFLKGSTAEKVQIFFYTFLRFKTADTARLRQLADDTEFGWYRKAWGALSSRPNDVCVSRGCMVLSDQPPPKKLGEDTEGGADDIRDRIRPNREKRKPVVNPLKKPDAQILVERLFTPNLGPRSGDWVRAPARLSFRLVAAPGSDLNGVQLKITAYRKSDNRIVNGAEQRAVYNTVNSTYFQPEFDPPMRGGIVPGFGTAEESRVYVNIDDVPGTEYGISCTIIHRTTGYNCTAGGPAENITRLSLVQPETSGLTRPGAPRDFRNFEDAFQSYRVGLPYTNAGGEYLPMQDAYPLFEIEFRRP